MLKILICCGGGFSSYYISKAMSEQMKQSGKQDEVQIEFSPFTLAGPKINEYDVACLCPHLRISVDSFIQKYQPQIPLYVLPKRMYGLMQFSDILDDSLDILEMYKENPEKNPVVFPNEEKYTSIERMNSYRKVYGDYHKYLKK